jgi:hypothetical protein
MTDMPSPQDDRLAEGAARMLRESADGLDAATLSRLNRARQAALAELDRRAARSSWLPEHWHSSIAVAAVVLVVVGIGILRGPLWVPESVATNEKSSDVDVLLADENLEMLDDLDFYDWMEPEESRTGPDQPMAG